MLLGLKRKLTLFVVNKLCKGTRPCLYGVKRAFMNWSGYSVGSNTKIVGPVRVFGELNIGKNCWIGTGFTVHGNGKVIIGDNCDVAPDVTFLTGSHKIGDESRRAGEGCSFIIEVEDGCWIGAKSTLMGNIRISRGCVIGAAALVNNDIPKNTVVGGVPARVIKNLAEK